jgi:SAM-dependent methyltransferase
MQDPIIDALIRIHEGIPRKGPGSDQLARSIIQRFACHVPADPRMADLGCGNGHSAFLLTELLGGHVTAVDFAPAFIDELRRRLEGHPRAGSITPVTGDMLEPGLVAGSCHLVWSEGAAFAVGIDNALRTWKPLLSPGGILVYSECCWFTPEPSPEVAAFWEKNYPDIRSVGENITRAEGLGYRFLAAEALPREAWWTSYFDPLGARLDEMEAEVEPGSVLQQVISDARWEADLFRRHGDEYGYAFFVLKAD